MTVPLQVLDELVRERLPPEDRMAIARACLDISRVCLDLSRHLVGSCARESGEREASNGAEQ